jgi:hypothetical protein
MIDNCGLIELPISSQSTFPIYDFKHPKLDESQYNEEEGGE